LNLLDQESEEWKQKEDTFLNRIRRLEDDNDEHMNRILCYQKEIAQLQGKNASTNSASASTAAPTYPADSVNTRSGEKQQMLTPDEKVHELETLVQALRSEKHHLSMSLESETHQKTDLQRLVQANVANFLKHEVVEQEYQRHIDTDRSFDGSVLTSKELIDRARKVGGLDHSPKMSDSQRWEEVERSRLPAPAMESMEQLSGREAQQLKSPPPPLFGANRVVVPNYLQAPRREHTGLSSRPTTAGTSRDVNVTTTNTPNHLPYQQERIGMNSRIDAMLAARKQKQQEHHQQFSDSQQQQQQPHSFPSAYDAAAATQVDDCDMSEKTEPERVKVTVDKLLAKRKADLERRKREVDKFLQ